MIVEELLVNLNDINLERAVLSCVLQEPDLLLTTKLGEDDFYNSEYQKLFNTLKQLKKDNQPCDYVSAMSYFKQHSDLGISPNLIPELYNQLIPISEFSNYEKQIIEYAYKRKMSLKLVELLTRIGKLTQEEIYQEVNKLINAGNNTDSDELQTLKDLVNKYIDDFSILKDTFFHSGLNSLDKIFNGFTTKSLYTIASRPSVGKTALAIQLIVNFLKQNKRICFFTLEMSNRQVLRRLLSAYTKISHTAITNGSLSDEQINMILNSLGELPLSNITFYDRGLLSIDDIERISYRLKQNNGLDIIIIDYLTLLNLPQGEKKVDSIAEVTRRLKLLAKQLDICVILLSQLNRQPEGRVDKKPNIGDLRDSGAIEQDSDVVCLLWRKPNESGLLTDEGEIIVAKSRETGIGNVKVRFNNDYLIFEEVENDKWGL